jgi:hypothetical protein
MPEIFINYGWATCLDEGQNLSIYDKSLADNQKFILELVPCTGDNCYQGEELELEKSFMQVFAYFDSQEFQKAKYDDGVVSLKENRIRSLPLSTQRITKVILS